MRTDHTKISLKGDENISNDYELAGYTSAIHGYQGSILGHFLCSKTFCYYLDSFSSDE